MMFPPSFAGVEVHLYFQCHGYTGWDTFLPFLPAAIHRKVVAKRLIKHWKLTSMPKDPAVFSLPDLGTFRLTDLRGGTARFPA